MRGDSSAAPRARRGFVAARAGRGKCEGEKQIPPGKGRALPEKPHSFERKKKCKKKKEKASCRLAGREESNEPFTAGTAGK